MKDLSCFEGRPCDLPVSEGFTPSHYSLKDEARNTETYHSWNSDLKLRHSRVSFISAGTSAAEDLNPVIQKSETCGEATESSVQERAPLGASKNQPTAYPNTPDSQMSKMTLNDLQAISASEVKSEHWLESTLNRRKMEEGLESRDAINEVFSIDHNGADELVHTNLVKSTKRRVPSSTGSDSSEEIIIFAGRRQSYNKGDQERTSNIRSRGMDAEVVPKPSRHRSSVATVMDDSINVKAQSNPTSSKHIPSSFSPPDPKRALVHLSCHSRAAATTFGRRTRRRGPRKETKDERVLDDYISNLRDGGGLEDLNESSMFKQRDLGGSDTAEWQDEVVSLLTGRVEKAPTMESRDWDSADLEGFVELSTSDEALESIVQVLSRRERPSGIQYLVVGADCTVDDARWLPVHSLNFPAAEALIQNFEDSAELDHLLSGSDTSDASPGIDEQMALDLQEDLDDKEDQEDLEERRKARMTDEQVAKLLSKQEELGLGSDDVVLFDGNDFGPDSQKELQLDGPWERAAIHPAAFRSKKMKRSRSDFPSATAFADIVDQDPDIDFDIMDQQRLNLRKRPKGRRGKPMELSDSELELSIHTAWEKDRIKKKLRKQEREDLRAQGLLGKKNQPDLKAKYAGGISMIDVKKEIKDFLLSSMERYVSSAFLPITTTYGTPV